MDILRPFPPARGQLKFLIVAIDYFTKWIEACPLAKIATENVQKFTWKNIICRFGIPHSLVIDNGLQFITQSFEDFLRKLGIKHLLTSVEHQQTNGQAEAANKVIL
uniref:Pol polyprotein n=1 Tax=Cajanus cajan TaxID=3821 RepID=A0A151TDU2_CAJCA|nr:Pol polyprotein [Cajanus cajan]